MQFLYPLFYRRVSDYNNKDIVEQAYSDLLNTLLPVYFVVSGLIVISAPYLLKVLVSDQYKDATVFVLLGACIEMCRVLGNLLSNAAHVKRNTKALALPYFAGALLSTVFIYFVGVNSFEIKWAGVGLLVGSIAMLILMAITMHQKLRFRLDLFRCTCGVLIMMLMFTLSESMPIFDTWLKSLLILILLGVISVFIIFSLLKKNPATHRLLEVQLREI
jgi:O-antigen/teichoic acid export membrane protein